MSRRGVGVSFVAIAAFLYASRYVAAAIFGSGLKTWNSDLFDGMLSYVGPELVTLSKIALVMGILYLIWGEYQEWTARRKTK